MKIILFILLTTITSECLYSQSLRIKVFNKTGFDVDSITVGDKYVGLIKKGDSIVIKDCKKIEMQGGLPWGLTYGVIKGKQKDRQLHGLCGTGRQTVTKGRFQFDLNITTSKFGYLLILSEHYSASR